VIRHSRSLRDRFALLPDRLARLPSPIVFALFFFLVALAHITLLRLPYYWDEGGYYIPAALDFYHLFTLIPHFTNAHPPLPNVLLGTLWHVTGPGILVTRLAVCAVAAAALTAVFRLGERLLTPNAGLIVTALTAVYPIWFAQSTLAHADIFAAAFTLWAFALYLPANVSFGSKSFRSNAEESVFQPRYFLVAALFSLAALSKETAIVEPATLAALHLTLLLTSPRARRENLRWLAALSFPLLPLLVWYAYHRYKTGFTFGNPEYLRYNATANFTAAHIAQAIYYRGIHLFWQRNIWLPILLALACLLLPRRRTFAPEAKTLPLHDQRSLLSTRPLWALTPSTIRIIAILIAGNWLAFSVLGGALLTRYLLPIYPLILLLCVDTWRTRTRWWPALAALTAAAFLSALWLNPPTAFAPEDNLTYRGMIVVQQNAIGYIADHYPGATVLTAWPVSTDLFNPWLGYVTQPIRVTTMENFTLPEVQKAAQRPGDYDTALVFATRYISPALARYYRAHPTYRRAREYAANRDLTPREIAAMLHGTIVFEQHLGGEWAAVLRFNRTYDAEVRDPHFEPVVTDYVWSAAGLQGKSYGREDKSAAMYSAFGWRYLSWP
jgi:4-amino-4-deoxy-L-arabinose transferase-like glycosyltransferase